MRENLPFLFARKVERKKQSSLNIQINTNRTFIFQTLTFTISDPTLITIQIKTKQLIKFANTFSFESIQNVKENNKKKPFGG